MYRTSRKLLSAMILAVMLTAVGCAANEEKQTQMDQTMELAQQASQEAEAARASAAESKQLAQEALDTARRALELAQANRERIERMFKETMQK